MRALNLLAFRLLADRRGVTAIEYAVLAGAVVVGLIAVFGTGADGNVLGTLKTKLIAVLGKIPGTT